MEENNRMIAEFMGRVGRDKLAHEYQDAHGLPKKEYHSSWDWLMPVVEKIESLELGDLKGLTTNNDGNKDEHLDCNAGVEIHGSYCNIYIQASMRLVDNFIEAHSENKITAVYNAVIEFIKWYNGITE